ncbi:hypothetical protein DPMN_039440 [Dreissena polymorpha]|uniref:Uncharacterized protein n=1 Tax=Dreissena polymorpha TaxID=45954 RepID=A0A9D4MEK0_DREPO|nr:hypothetical protein DPMN_039440 [Dreissena polymorpha]
MSNNRAGFVVPQPMTGTEWCLQQKISLLSQTEDWNGVVLATENRFVVPQTEDWDEEIDSTKQYVR